MRLVLIALLFVFTTGCAKVVDDFVKGGDPAVTPPGPIGGDGDNDDLSNQLKLSPGMVRSNATGIAMQARITTTRHVMTGSNVSAVVGLHKSR
jgi:hypothetical protein